MAGGRPRRIVGQLLPLSVVSVRCETMEYIMLYYLRVISIFFFLFRANLLGLQLNALYIHIDITSIIMIVVVVTIINITIIRKNTLRLHRVRGQLRLHGKCVADKEIVDVPLNLNS